ncbi:MAG TPA: hypothetical protein VF170_04135 [Planctomycetaceae bacterium]
MRLSSEGRADGPTPTGRPGPAGRSAPSPATGPSAPASRPPRPGSLERLLASVDAQLPGHLRRLAAAPGSPGRGRGVRAGVFPGYVLVEWRSVGGLPEHYALAWRLDADGLRLGDELIPVDAVAERLGSWSDLLNPSHKETDAHARLERLAEQLRQTAAERDRLAERLAARGPTSVLRRPGRAEPIADDQFVRAIRRR